MRESDLNRELIIYLRDEFKTLRSDLKSDIQELKDEIGSIQNNCRVNTKDLIQLKVKEDNRTRFSNFVIPAGLSLIISLLIGFLKLPTVK